jgi:hypothetical protein
VNQTSLQTYRGQSNAALPSKSGERELKFVFPFHRLPFVLQWLKHSCRPDSKFPYNLVSTVYYDTSDRQFLRQKLNSEYLKTKVRVRWYTEPGQEPQSVPAWLEIKQKIGAQRQKCRIELQYSGERLSSMSLENSIWRDLPRILPSHGIVLNEAIFPVFLLNYTRHRFVEPLSKVRVCVDCYLSVSKVNRNILPTIAPVQNHSAVIEVKGAVTGLPDTLHHLLNMGCVKTSFSKYLMCYQQLEF